ncbi:MAG: DUF4112 domain-containing protein [Verrucomicrobiaceae bacterium]|nr:DUF4112 domain-containing protein [Verrucomicrobiaceae bacterium]
MRRPPGDHIKVEEVLPPAKGRHASAGPTQAEDPHVRAETSRIIAYWLDEFIRIPGTKIRIGLDPIVAFVPVIGDFLASSAGVVILIEAARHGVSIPVLARMGVNMLINTGLDAIPGIGPVVSAFFKSNSRNLHLLHRWQAGQHMSVKRGTLALFVFVALCFVFAVALWTGLWFFYFSVLVKLIKGGTGN